MDIVLAETLINKGIIREQLEVQARFKSKGLSTESVTVSGSFTIREIQKHGTDYRFKLVGINDGKQVIVTQKSIRAIDGMEPERFARIFNVNPDGSIKKRGKKRGRKTKVERMRLALLNCGFRFSPSVIIPEETMLEILNHLFPENGNEDPSFVPCGEDVIAALDLYGIPYVEAANIDPEEDNFWSWE